MNKPKRGSYKESKSIQKKKIIVAGFKSLREILKDYKLPFERK